MQEWARHEDLALQQFELTMAKWEALRLKKPMLPLPNEFLESSVFLDFADVHVAVGI